MILYDETTWPIDVLNCIEKHQDIFRGWEQRRIGQLSTMEISGYKYDDAVNDLRSVLSKHTLRGFHCTRLTEVEIGEIINHGMTPQNATSLSERINKLLISNIIDTRISRRLKSENQADEDNRAGMIWFCFFPPHKAGQDGIERFFRSWGGEALYNSHEEDDETGHILREIGIPCVIEADVPIAGSPHSFLEEKMTRTFLIKRGLNTPECIDYEGYSSVHIPVQNIRQIFRFPEAGFMNLTNADKWSPAL